MGLDMYLYLSSYESDLSHDVNKVKDFYPPELLELGKKHTLNNFLSKSIEYQIGYWRKANAIHKFFVDNCADGTDDCKLMWVSDVTLKRLKEYCDEILKDKSKEKADELLPTTEGFFFGTTDYDDWYFEDLKYTSELIADVLDFLEKNKGWSVEYCASW